MDNPTAPTDWRTVLREQGRNLTWLAAATGRPRRTVYAYHQRRLPPTAEWLAKVSDALGVPVIDEAGPLDYGRLTAEQKARVRALLALDEPETAA